MELKSDALATPDQAKPGDASGGAGATGTAGGGEVKAGVSVGGGK
jgi:hypothetical protein